ncbi:MAG: hypothetical protein WAW75_03160, partial [Gallionella sp.]
MNQLTVDILCKESLVILSGIINNKHKARNLVFNDNLAKSICPPLGLACLHKAFSRNKYKELDLECTLNYGATNITMTIQVGNESVRNILTNKDLQLP